MFVPTRDRVLAFLRRHPRARDAVLSLLNKGNLLLVDYPVRSRPRYGYGRPPHPQLAELLERSRARYEQVLLSFSRYGPKLAQIPQEADDPSIPVWNSRFTSGLDAVAIYGFIAERSPSRYIEVGSGNSTKFARQAIADHALSTRITSIDPHPRAEVDRVCDEVVRAPIEDVDLSLFEALGPGDIVYVDNSHRAFMNSDVTVTFLDVLPRLAGGVLIGFDDIYLPVDYPPEWRYRYYSEQYLLAAYLLAGGNGVKIELPCAFVSDDPSMQRLIQEQFPAAIPTGGTSFWLEIA